MKNFLSILFILPLFISCSEDNDKVHTSGDLIGTWNLVSIDYVGSTTAEEQGETITSSFVGEAYDVDMTMTISENPNKVTAEGSYSLELTTTILGQTQTDYEEDLNLIDTSDWSKSGNKFTMSVDGLSTTFDIIELSDDKFIINYNGVEVLEDSGVKFTVEIDQTIEFSR